jgi:predicted DNA-binding transcriptional regulator YafY
LRKDFRSFRIDRIMKVTFFDERYPERRTALRIKWMKDMHLSRMRER